MASNYTANYNLNQWEPNDQVLREEFNGDNQKLDAALAGLAGQVAAKASQTDMESSVSGLQTQINAKAAQTALDSLSATVTKKYGTDNPYLKVGTYTGNGGASVSVTTGFQPSLVIILSLSASGSYDFGLMIGNGTAQFLETMFNSRCIYTDALQVTSTGFTVTHTSNYTDFNTEGCDCLYFAFR